MDVSASGCRTLSPTANATAIRPELHPNKIQYFIFRGATVKRSSKQLTYCHYQRTRCGIPFVFESNERAGVLPQCFNSKDPKL
ncbi:unnamed protein product [Gongylonema pulchrum]|uniref:PilZ domain-containing protein n=1 Tax=Gongylonema pulchrum TaxID=637853 RepID=A0A183E113_9BILA|nr:unnamed protein product [Gongylonema pulchrum]